MTQERALFALTSVFCLQSTDLIPEDRKESVLISTLNVTGFDNETISEMVTLLNNESAEELMRALGASDEFLEEALEAFEEKLS